VANEEPSRVVRRAARARISAGLLVRLYRHLNKSRQRQFLMLIALMLVSALAEVVSLGAVLPFIGILASPQLVFKRRVVADAAIAWGITSPEQLVLPLTVIFVAAAILSGAIRVLLLWLSMRFTFASGAELSIDVYRRTLYQPYHVHVARSSSEVISGTMNKVGGTVLGVLLPLLTLLSSIILLVALVIALIAIDPVIAIVAAACFGTSYGCLTWVSRRRLRRNSQLIAVEQTRMIKAVQEGLGGIRDVLLDGTQDVYCEVYRRADEAWRRAQGENVFIGQSPKAVMETLGMVLLALFAYGLSRRTGGLANALPVLGALALGAQRLLPALQAAFTAWASIAGSQASLRDTIEMLDQPISSELLEPKPAPLPFRSAVRFQNVRFRYAPDLPWVLDGFDLTIAKGSRIGFVGTTGSGKSTALDLLMGLLVPNEGAILVDDQPLAGGRIRAWQQTIAHVPQNIFLADSTLAENIALGVPPSEIEMQRVRIAARQAHIAEFIESLPGGYDGRVGERGVRLSGGQRQRIGIARALYKQATVLVLDEATSALDSATEQSVMDAIDGLDRTLTVFIIAHRITTVRRCDSIVELEFGRVRAQGSYQQLVDSSQSFRRIADAATLNR
jgi:ABC-type multidrug transport system fused ATPase/permease subunit